MGDWQSIFKKSGRVFAKPQEDMVNVIKHMKKNNIQTVLDLGCGSGRHTVLMAKMNFEVYGMDISEEGLKLTKKWLKDEGLQAVLKKASCYHKLPFGKNFFDAIISTQVIHHNYHDKIKFCISEIKRVLKPDGLIFISVSADRFRKRAKKAKMTKPRTYVPLDGPEKGLPHYIYNQKILRKDFSNFKILSLHKDSWNHYCITGRLKKK